MGVLHVGAIVWSNFLSAKKIIYRGFLKRYSSKTFTFNELKMLDNGFGVNRGTPIDRVLIQRFLSKQILELQVPEHASVLEIGDSRYSNSFLPSVSKAVLNLKKGQEIDFDGEDLVGDLTCTPRLESIFDCILLTQVLAFTSNPFSASDCLLRLLKPGGWIIGTEPQLTALSLYDYRSHGDYFRFTPMGLRAIYESSSCGFDNFCFSHLGNLQDSLNLMMGVVLEDGVKVGAYNSIQHAPTIGYKLQRK
jgi:hypothetical protein